MKSISRLRCCIICFLLLSSISGLKAQDVQPRVYAPVPTGLNVLTLGYSYSFGAMLFDKTIPIENVEANVSTFSTSYSRSIALFGKSGRFDLALPLVSGSWEGEILENTERTSRFGMGDPVLRYTLFIAGAPALSAEKFETFEPKTIVGMTMRMTLPVGQYDANKLINLGSNRWVFSPQVGVWHKTVPFTFEAYTGIWIFSDNKDFFGSQVRSQKPLYTFQVHASYEFENGLWIAASTRQSLGGVVTVDDSNPLDPESNNRLGLSVSIPIAPKYFIKVLATTAARSTVGNDYTTLGLAWQMVF